MKRVKLILILILMVALIVVSGILVYKINENNIENDESKTAKQEVEDTSEEDINKKEHRFDKITLLYDYGDAILFSDTLDKPPQVAYEIDLQGEDLRELQDILKKYDIENKKYRVEDTGHYHGSQFYSNIFLLFGIYRLDFNDGTEMIVSNQEYKTQYKVDGKYYEMDNCYDLVKKLTQIVKKEVYKNPVTIETEKISITGLTSGNFLEIDDKSIINILLDEYLEQHGDLNGYKSAIDTLLNEYRYMNDSIVSEELIQSLIEQDESEYRRKSKEPDEIGYKIDFNNGEQIIILLRNGNVGYMIDAQENYLYGLKINPPFIQMVHEIMTDNLTEEEINIINQTYAEDDEDY